MKESVDLRGDFFKENRERWQKKGDTVFSGCIIIIAALVPQSINFNRIDVNGKSKMHLFNFPRVAKFRQDPIPPPPFM